jgi:hypothetical protein
MATSTVERIAEPANLTRIFAPESQVFLHYGRQDRGRHKSRPPVTLILRYSSRRWCSAGGSVQTLPVIPAWTAGIQTPWRAIREGGLNAYPPAEVRSARIGDILHRHELRIPSPEFPNSPFILNRL